MNFWPSKKIFAVALFLAIIAGAVWWYGRPKTPATANQTANQENETLGHFSSEYKAFSSSPATINQITETFTESALQKKELAELDIEKLPPDYSKNKLVAGGSGKEAIRTYGLRLAEALGPFAEPRDNEGDVLVNAFDTNDWSGILKIIDSRKKFQTLEKVLLTIPTPTELIDDHLALINTAKDCGWFLSNMTAGEKEPILALESGREYLEANKNFFLATALISKKIFDSGVMFSEKERINLYDNTGEQN